MNVVGIIAEYNPFHNGHLYHLEQSKKISSADHVVCVMSSNFIQRGEPALIDKWSRAEMALSCGADLVLELPVVYSMSSAEFFAFGAVKILDSLGIVNNICFGSESGNMDELLTIAGILNNEPPLYKNLLKEYLSKGLSYPSAREFALKRYFDGASEAASEAASEVSPVIPAEVASEVSSGAVSEVAPEFTHGLSRLMASSNNILGIEYLKALKKLGSKIVPLTISRIGNTYNTTHFTGAVSSATSIRKHIFENPSAVVKNALETVMPPASLTVLLREFENGRGPVSPEFFGSLILSTIRKLPPDHIRSFPYITEGLENRIKEAANDSGSLNELIEKICTKRYTRTRIQRILFNLLAGITVREFEEFNKYGGPQYIRVLGLNNKGRAMLSQINKKALLPVIVKSADYKNDCNRLIKRMMEIEAQSTDIYVLGYKNPEFKKAGREYTRNVVRAGLKML